jgi:hypothetical protein
MSSKIQVVKFQPEHLELIEIKENFHPSECPKVVMNTAFTLIGNGKVLAIIGGFPFVPGVIHFWSLISIHVRECPIAFHKEILKVLDWYEKNEKPRRLQWEVRASYTMGQRWAESLGLKKEGLMKQWMPDGEDAYLYARVNACLS